MTNYMLYTIIALVALLIGLLVAEYHWRKSLKQANHVVPTAITKNSSKIVWQKTFYYGLFITFLLADHLLDIKLPEACYYLDVFALVGGDIQKLANKFFRLK